MDTLTHHTIEIPEKNIRKYIPRELAYCNPAEFKDIAFLLYQWQNADISYQDFKTQALYKLLNLKKGKRKINNLEVEAAMSNIAQIDYIIDSFFDVTERSDKRIRLNLIQNPVPFVKPVFIRIFGPKARLTNTNFGQYIDASHEYQMYYTTQDEKYLYKLFAIYYQEPSRYDNDNTEKKAKFFEKTIDFALVFSFFLYFESVQNYITGAQVIWEGNTIDLSILFSSAGKQKSDLPGLGTKSLSFMVAESGVFGNIKELRSEKLWEILLRLYDIRKRDIDAEADAKSKEKK